MPLVLHTVCFYHSSSWHVYYSYFKFSGWYFQHLSHTFDFDECLVFSTLVCMYLHTYGGVYIYLITRSFGMSWNFFESQPIILDNRYWSKQTFCVRIYVTAARSWAVFNAWCSLVPEASNSSCVLGLVTFNVFILFLSTALQTESVSCCSFSCDFCY